MDREWNDSQPIYRQLRDRIVAMILDGVLNECDPLPSVRTVAAESRVNPITVMKGYQQLVDEGLVETRRGLGMFVKDGARNLLLKAERERFLKDEWPRVREHIETGPTGSADAPHPTFADGLRVQEVMDAAYRSAEIGGAVAVAS